jgi:hypothetical protein
MVNVTAVTAAKFVISSLLAGDGFRLSPFLAIARGATTGGLAIAARSCRRFQIFDFDRSFRRAANRSDLRQE